MSDSVYTRSATPVYRRLAQLVLQKQNLLNREFIQEAFLNKCNKNIKAIMENFPSGSGFDNSTSLDMTRSTPERLVFNTSYHHMNDVGMYDGWSEHSVTVTPSLVFGINMKISGPNRRDIKNLIGEMFHLALMEDTTI